MRFSDEEVEVIEHALEEAGMNAMSDAKNGIRGAKKSEREYAALARVVEARRAKPDAVQAALEFVETVARLLLDGAPDGVGGKYEQQADDAIETLESLITLARMIQVTV